MKTCELKSPSASTDQFKLVPVLFQTIGKANRDWKDQSPDIVDGFQKWKEAIKRYEKKLKQRKTIPIAIDKYKKPGQ